MSRRYQRGSLYREKRMTGPDIWVFRWRDGTVNRKQQIGTVEQFPTKTKALKACELLRADINREARSPHTVAELVDHYTKHELPNKTPYTAEVYAGYLKTWILPKWGAHSLSDVKAVAVEAWLGTLPLANGTRAKLRNLMHALYNHAILAGRLGRPKEARRELERFVSTAPQASYAEKIAQARRLLSALRSGGS